MGHVLNIDSASCVNGFALEQNEYRNGLLMDILVPQNSDGL